MGRKSSFTDEQIIRALKEVDAGAKATEVCRRLGVTEQTFYRWKLKFGGRVARNPKATGAGYLEQRLGQRVARREEGLREPRWTFQCAFRRPLPDGPRLNCLRGRLAMTLPRRARLVLLSLHLLVIGGWFGGVLAMALLVGAARPGLDVAAFVVNDVVVWSSLAVLATSLAFSLFTSWGFFRFVWVTVKWIALMALAALGVLVRTVEVNRLAAHADLTGTPGARSTLIGLLAAEALALAAIFALSALKPWGRLRTADTPPSGGLVAAVCAGFLAAGGFAVLQSVYLARLRATPIAAVDITKVPDGRWEGTAEVGVTARVRATTEGGRLASVEVLELPRGVYPDLARGITARMVERQRIDVDCVSGATTTSRAIQKAAEVALRTGGAAPPR